MDLITNLNSANLNRDTTESQGDEYGDVVRVDVRNALGIQSFGYALIEFDSNTPEDTWQSPDHAEDGQEELYFVAAGSGECKLGDGDWTPIGETTFVHVDPGTSRAFRTTDNAMSLVAVSGIPGQAYRELAGITIKDEKELTSEFGKSEPADLDGSRGYDPSSGDGEDGTDAIGDAGFDGLLQDLGMAGDDELVDDAVE